MRRHLASTALGAALAAALLAGAACGGDDPDSGNEDEPQLSPEVVAACEQYSEVLNDWSRQYGDELGQVGEAESNGDEDRKEAAVEAVRGLFEQASGDLRTQADATSDEELSSNLTTAADGLADIAGRIETYDDVTAAAEWMSEGDFAQGGERVNQICAGQ